MLWIRQSDFDGGGDQILRAPGTTFKEKQRGTLGSDDEHRTTLTYNGGQCTWLLGTGPSDFKTREDHLTHRQMYSTVLKLPLNKPGFRIELGRMLILFHCSCGVGSYPVNGRAKTISSWDGGGNLT